MPSRSSLNVSLTPQLEELVRRKVESGLYGSASEVMREALRLLDEHDRLRSMRLEELRTEIQNAITHNDVVCLTCYEDQPSMCHRSVIIAELKKKREPIIVQHLRLDETGLE